MNVSKKNLLNPSFSHIYIEKEITHHPRTQKILSYFPKARQIEISHYKDVFCRSRQNDSLQKQTPCLILAKKRKPLLYDGPPVCQSFGNRYFYYATSVMNCVFDCEYCYLQGMYPSANLVVFVNLEEIFNAVASLLQRHPVYLCISYDTDLLALDSFLGYVREWFDFTASHPELTVELRTKSAGWSPLAALLPQNNVVLAWTLSPEPVRESFEHNTPSLIQRIQCAHKALEKGFPVRICFDPLVYINDWEARYRNMVETVFSTIPAQNVLDVSIGGFRIPVKYLKKMRKQRPDSLIIHYPFTMADGIAQYDAALNESMIRGLREMLWEHMGEEKIFIWQGIKGG